MDKKKTKRTVTFELDPDLDKIIAARAQKEIRSFSGQLNFLLRQILIVQEEDK